MSRRARPLLARQSNYRVVRAFERRSYVLAKALYQRRVRRDGYAPIVILSMGKTGTSAVADALRRAGIGPAFQVHSLRPAVVAEFERRYRAADPKGRPYHIWDSQRLFQNMPTPDAPWQVVTMVRDPLRQVVAAFFQAGPRFGYIREGTTAAEVRAAFGDRWERLPLDWFHFQFEHWLGLDVFASPFDPAVGYGIIETPAIRVLLLRQESLAVAPTALGEFFGVTEPLAVRRLNVGAEKDYAALYDEFLTTVRPPPEVIERAYSSRLVRHFYAPEEIAGFRAYWSGTSAGRAVPPDVP